MATPQDAPVTSCTIPKALVISTTPQSVEHDGTQLVAQTAALKHATNEDNETLSSEEMHLDTPLLSPLHPPDEYSHQTLSGDGIEITSVHAAQPTTTREEGCYRLPVELHPGGRQNDFPVKFNHGYHIYYHISDWQLSSWSVPLRDAA